MGFKTDESDHQFIEIQITDGQIRVTYIPKGWDGSPAIRYQIKDNQTGRLRQGPEVPIGHIGDMFSATLNLLINQ